MSLKICCSIKKNCDIIEKMSGNPDWNKKDRWIFYYGRLFICKRSNEKLCTGVQSEGSYIDWQAVWKSNVSWNDDWNGCSSEQRGSTFCCKCRTCKTYCGSCIPSRFDDGNSAGGRAVYWWLFNGTWCCWKTYFCGRLHSCFGTCISWKFCRSTDFYSTSLLQRSAWLFSRRTWCLHN